MTSDTEKLDPPPYISFGTFLNFIKGLKATGVPSRIDKSLLRTLSGSTQAAMIAALKWLGLIDDAGLPEPALEALVQASESEYPAVLGDILKKSYGFLSDGSIVLTKATGAQVEQKFREYGIQGSTVIKAVGFFITAAKEAKIELGPHVKAPKQIPSNGAKRQLRKAMQESKGDEEQTSDEEDLGDRPGFVKITIPLHSMQDGMVYLPEGLSAAQWAYVLKITKFILDNYRFDGVEEGSDLA